MIVIAEKWFQLGNRLFAMAHVIAAAAENRWTVANPAFEDYADYFETTRRDPWCRFPPRRAYVPWPRWLVRLTEWPVVRLSRLLLKHHLNTRVMRTIAVSIHDEVRLDTAQFERWASRTWLLFCHGWSFRAPSAFERQADLIRSYFRPVPELMQRARIAAETARDGADVLVGVHIRQGDYKEHLGGRFYYETTAYVRWMQHMQTLLPDKRIGFLICSNVEQDPVAFKGLQMTKGDGHLVVDLYSLARCDYIVGPPSTFSQWASFYGRVPLCIVRDAKEAIVMTQFEVFTAGMRHT